MTTFTTDDRVSAELEVMPASSSTVTSQVPIAFQCFKTPEHYVLEANIPEEIEYIKSLGFQRLVPLYDRPAPQEWVISAKYRELTDEEKWEIFTNLARSPDLRADMIRFADSILRKASE